MESSSLRVRQLRLPVAQDLAEDDGVGQVAVLKIYIGEELVVEGAEHCGDVFVLDARAFQNDHCAGDCSISEVVEIHGGKVIAIAESEKALG